MTEPLPQFVWCLDQKGKAGPCKVVGSVLPRTRHYELPLVTPRRLDGKVLVTLPAADGEQACSVWWPESQLESHRGGVAPEAF